MVDDNKAYEEVSDEELELLAEIINRYSGLLQGVFSELSAVKKGGPRVIKESEQRIKIIKKWLEHATK
jgi:hypothetical protein